MQGYLNYRIAKWLLVVILLTTVLILSVCACGTTPQATTLASVTFPDANLETAIREAIDKPEGPIYTFELESLAKLNASKNGISDLTGLGYCLNLQELMLWNNNISDISALADLSNLQNLYLDGNNISDISALASLNNLETLHLYDNDISDISALAGLINLKSLLIDGNNISDISALAGLSNLWGLGLEGNDVSNISALVDNTGLSNGNSVNLIGNPLSTESINNYIFQLEERGVTVYY